MFLSRRSVELIESKLLHEVVRVGAVSSDPTTGEQIGKVIGVQFMATAVTPEGIIGDDGGAGVRVIIQLPDGSTIRRASWTVVEDRYAPETGNLIDDVLQDEITVEGFCKLVGCDQEQANQLIEAVRRSRKGRD